MEKLEKTHGFNTNPDEVARRVAELGAELQGLKKLLQVQGGSQKT